LLFSGFPGLAQLGLYALSGVITAAVVTRFVLPQLSGKHLKMRDLAPLGRQLEKVIPAIHCLRWPVIALALAAATTLFIQRGELWNPELSALSPISSS
jgi:predicted exporter